jgi:arylsulfatase A
LAGVFLAACQSIKPSGSGIRPNVILILADDMAYGDLSLINGGMTHTPELDQLARESAWFTQGYSAAPVCAPARAALLTGLHPHQTGCVTLGMQRFPELSRISKGIPTMADVFSENGYATGLVGKWHCGDGPDYHPMQRGFQEFEGFLGYMVDTYEEYQLDINQEIQSFSGKYLTDDLSERAIDFIRRHKEHPFFLHLAHYAPHRPLGAPEEMVDYYLSQGHSRNTATIYAMIEVMDHGIGQLMAELDKLGIRENTIIIFLSDNGPDPVPGERDNLGLKGTKYTVYEGGIHVPFFIQWKGTFDPATFAQVAHFTDLFPTLVDLCNLQMSESIPFVGASLEKVLNGEESGELPEVRYWQWNRGVPYYSHNAAMRQGPWKLVRPFVTRNVPEAASEALPVLYNLENDPFEEVDVSATYRSRYQTMSVMLEAWSREVEHERLKNKNEEQ